MTRRVMDNLYEELIEIGMHFEECHFRILSQCNGGGDDLVCYGLLRDDKESEITNERLELALALAKERSAYLIIRPGVVYIDKKQKAKRMCTELKKNEIAVGIIQAGIFRTFGEAYEKTNVALKRHFLHFQEDEDILDLEERLEKVSAQLQNFTTHAYNLNSLYAGSTLLRLVLTEEGNAFARKKEIFDYTNDCNIRSSVETMCLAVEWLKIVYLKSNGMKI